MSATSPDLLSLLREYELRRLDTNGQVYLDYTGAAPYPESLLRAHHAVLRREVFGNPHSENPASRASAAVAREARRALLGFLDADEREYEIVWTANASAALRLIGEAFPFGPATPFVLTADNHNSVNGIREYARAKGAPVTHLPLDDELRVLPFDLPRVAGRHGLFAFPAQSNFSGVQHPLSWVKTAQQRGYQVLLDAAAFLPSNPISLRSVSPDFLTLSIYKLCGYPTGLGALVARRSALAALVRPSFTGGTVEYVSVLADRYLLRAGPEAFEDGTCNFLALSAVPLGLALLERLGLPAIQSHAKRLTQQLLDGLRGLRHANGAPLVWLHGPAGLHDRGGTVAFNLLAANGRIIEYENVEERAAAAGIALRGGCFCNPGCAEASFGYSAHELEAALASLDSDFTQAELRQRLAGKAVGALRASVGYGSTPFDIDRLLQFLPAFLNESAVPILPEE